MHSIRSIVLLAAFMSNAVFAGPRKPAQSVAVGEAKVDCRDHSGKTIFRGHLQVTDSTPLKVEASKPGFQISGFKVSLEFLGRTLYSDCNKNRFSVTLDSNEEVLFCASGRVSWMEKVSPIGVVSGCELKHHKR
jgi:hypothetical protein